MARHWGIYIDNKTNKKTLLQKIIRSNMWGLSSELSTLKVEIYSRFTIEKLIEEELRHDRFVVSSERGNSLQSMSSGQQRKSLLRYQLAQRPDIMLLDDVYANVDINTQGEILERLQGLTHEIQFIQIFSRKNDLLPFVDKILLINESLSSVKEIIDSSVFLKNKSALSDKLRFSLPANYEISAELPAELIVMRNVSVSYAEKHVLTQVNWTIRQGEFWQLVGPNGSGKSTLVTMIAGDNPKAYGQNMYLFGRKKGSGETIWDIKKQVGYFTPSLVQQFKYDDTVENMILSGFVDSIGLYTEPTDMQRKIARQWLEILGNDFKNKSFQQLHPGMQRMVMVARAIVKHPPLLILDEPTVDLDDANAQLFVEMFNSLAAERKMAIVYISHRAEENLKPEKILELIKAEQGYTAIEHDLGL